MTKQQELIQKEQQFAQAYGEYQTKSFELITVMFNNLNPAMSADAAAKINELFNKTSDSLERVTELGKAVAKERIEQEKKLDRMQLLAN
jgi:tellurite resistance protein